MLIAEGVMEKAERKEPIIKTGNEIKDLLKTLSIFIFVSYLFHS